MENTQFEQISATVESGSSIEIIGQIWDYLKLLSLLFIGLKLAGYIEWNWLAVLTPLWLPLAGLVMLAVLCGAIGVKGKISG